MEQNKMCKSCTNIDTPICDACVTVHTAKGARTPSKYCGYVTDDADQIIIEDLAAMIESRIKHNRPIPIRYVIKYNRLQEVRRNGKKENISAP
jgi:hypothetical protein